MSGDETITASWRIHCVLTTKLLHRLRDRPAENLTTKRQGDLVAAGGLSDLADALNFSCSARRFLLVALRRRGDRPDRFWRGRFGSSMLVFRGDSEPDFANIRRPLGTIP